MSTLRFEMTGVWPPLSVRRFAIRESVSDIFSITVVACWPRPDLELDRLILQPASLCLTAGWAFVHGAGSRIYTGLCESIEQLQAEPSGLSTYSIHLVPRLWQLTLRTTYRIFQHQSIPDIVTRILDEHSIVHAWHVYSAAHPKLDYKVQHGESDFAFVCRLCEEAGITFIFQSNEDGQSILFLTDAPCAAEPRASALPYVDNPNQAAEKEFVTGVRQFRRGQPLAVALRDYDFRNPSLSLFEQTAVASSTESLLSTYRYEPGAFRRVTDAPSSKPLADKMGIARHEPSYGQSRVKQLLLGNRPSGHGISFETNALDLAPGTVFSIASHPHPALGEAQKLLVTQFQVEGEHDKEWRAQGKAVLADQPYQPPRRTQKPVVHGLQTAVVTGPPGREVFTDEYGRVRVQFPWDRYGKNNEESSCWIRVSQGWAGAGFGLHALPRVGQEVLVGFLAGDPDEPIIVGRAPNAHNPPPYPLPANETKTVWRSQSTPGGDGFNEISFEDKKGEERFYERAEKDKESLVRNDEQILVGRNRAKVVKGAEDIATLGDRRELIGGDDHRTVNGEQREQIKGSRSLIIEGDWHIRVSGRLLLEAGGEIHLLSETKIVSNAPDITHDAGGGFVHVTGAGIEVDGGAVLIQAGGAPSSGADSCPVTPELPTTARGVLGTHARPVFNKLPMFPYGNSLGIQGYGPDYERDVICRAICTCDGAHNGTQRVSQWCVTLALWEYDKRLAYQSTIKAEVPYDMSKRPPEPIPSNNNPNRSTHGKPAGSEVPDVVVVYDGTKPPRAGNIKTIYEIKFGDDRLGPAKQKVYQSIDGGAEFEVLSPEGCGCDKDGREPDPLPQPISATDAAKAALFVLLALATIAALLDPAPGDEVAALNALTKMWPEVAPILARLSPVLTALMARFSAVTPPPVLLPR